MCKFKVNNHLDLVVKIEPARHITSSKQAAVARGSATTEVEGQTVVGWMGLVVLERFRFDATIALEPAGTGIVPG